MHERFKKLLTSTRAHEMLVEVRGGKNFRSTIERGEVIWNRRIIGDLPYEVIDEMFSTYLNFPKTPCGYSIPQTDHKVLVILIDGNPLEQWVYEVRDPNNAR